MTNDDILSLPRLIASVKREFKIVLACAIGLAGLALLYSFVATPKFTANTSIMLDPAHAQTLASLSSKVSGRFDDAAIVSQIELVKSRRVAKKALEYLSSNGTNTPGNLDAVIDEELLERTIDGLRVYREGESYVLTIKYTASSPKVAAQRANAFAQAYIYDQINAFSDDSSKTTEWLQNKIRDLRNQSIAANLEIQKFREKHNIVETGGGTVNEQQLGSVNNNLNTASAEVAAARVRYLHSKRIVDSNDVSAAMAEAFDNDVINNVRAQYLEGQQKLLELRRTLGTGHEAVKKLSVKQAESRRVIFSEMKRIAQSYKNEYEVALANENSLKKNMGKLVDAQRADENQSFELAALEKEAEAYANLYDEYLARFETMQQQHSFPVADSRVITKAVPPLKKSHPKSILLTGLGLILGTGLGVLLALLKDNSDPTFKRAGQIENQTGLHFLGFVPSLKGKSLGASTASVFLDAEYTQSVDTPLSIQAETCRNIKMTAHKKRKGVCKVIGVTSDNPHVGKSVSASNLALYIAQSGCKCLLIDADVRNPSLSDNNFTHIENGIGAVLSQNATLDKAVMQDSKTKLFVLPCEQKGRLNTSDLVSSDVMEEMVVAARAEFDYIIIDLPPLSATSDASFASAFVDFFLLSLEWGKSKPNSLNFNLKVSEITKEKILGVVLSEADMKTMSKNYGHTIYPEYTKA